MIKKIFKRIFILIARLLNFEIIDQNNFSSPTLNSNLNNNISKINTKSIVLPLGEVKITRKINSLLVVFRSNTIINIWDQNKKRIFNKPKKEYTFRSLNSLLISLNKAKNKFENIKFKIIVVDDNSEVENLTEIKRLLEKSLIENKLENLNKNEFQDFIIDKKNKETFSNLASLLKCFKVAKQHADDLVLFVEDDYLHEDTMIEEMLMTYERISSQLNDEIFLCPSDYPFFYDSNNKTNILIGSHRHWQIIDKTLCTFLTSKIVLNENWNNFVKNCEKRHDPFEKYINEIYKRIYCLAPIPSLSVHFTNINSSYGISPYIDIRNLWEKNKP